MNVKGEELALSEDTWAECLRLAVSAGWVPAGTAAPPAAVSGVPSPLEPWSGSYSEIRGQELTRRDARSLGTALKHACPRGISPFEDIIRMADRGGFLLLPGAAPAELAPGSDAGKTALATATHGSKVPFVPR